MKSFIEFLNESKEQINESSLSRLWRKYKESDSGTISAFRGEYSKSENMERNKKLQSILIGAGFSVTAVDGVYIENMGTPEEKRVKEKSFIVFDYQNKGNLKEVLKALGEKFDQDAVAYSDASTGKYILIGTTKRDNGGVAYHQEVTLGKPMFGKGGEMYSSVKGRPFIFEEVDEKLFDNTMLNFQFNTKLFFQKENKDFLNEWMELTEASLGRLVQHFQNGDCIAIVSAFRGERSKAENMKLTKQLRTLVLGAGFGFNKVIGGYSEKLDDGTVVNIDDEHSTIIYATPERENELRKFVISLGKKYNQDSVLFVGNDRKATWIFTRPDNFMNKPVGSTMELGDFHPKQIGVYFTKIGKKNFSFVMQESEEVTRWSQHELKVTTVEMRGLDYMKKVLKECATNGDDFYEAYLKDVNF